MQDMILMGIKAKTMGNNILLSIEFMNSQAHLYFFHTLPHTLPQMVIMEKKVNHKILI